jgi:hypothetical protein
MLVMGRLVVSTWTDKYGQSRNDVRVRVSKAEVGVGPRPRPQPSGSSVPLPLVACPHLMPAVDALPVAVDQVMDNKRTNPDLKYSSGWDEEGEGDADDFGRSPPPPPPVSRGGGGYKQPGGWAAKGQAGAGGFSTAGPARGQAPAFEAESSYDIDQELPF